MGGKERFKGIYPGNWMFIVLFCSVLGIVKFKELLAIILGGPLTELLRVLNFPVENGSMGNGVPANV